MDSYPRSAPRDVVLLTRMPGGCPWNGRRRQSRYCSCGVLGRKPLEGAISRAFLVKFLWPS
ncbi:MAG: hypothetical protein FD130_945 [Halothiobacillaceae bacterium]|nr:MAG: hypothetical protein FD130_945 [Halothiobacillaceae bacterium]